MKDDNDDVFGVSPIDHRSDLAELRAKYPYPEDRACMVSNLNAKCPLWMKEDFDHVCRALVGEAPSVVLRGLVRSFIHANTK